MTRRILLHRHHTISQSHILPTNTESSTHMHALVWNLKFKISLPQSRTRTPRVTSLVIRGLLHVGFIILHDAHEHPNASSRHGQMKNSAHSTQTQSHRHREGDPRTTSIVCRLFAQVTRTYTPELLLTRPLHTHLHFALTHIP